MASNGTVWVIERGSYSDYRVSGVYSSKENAAAIAAEINKKAYDKAEVAEWPLDPGLDALNQGLKLFRVRMDRAGALKKIGLSPAVELLQFDPRSAGAWHIYPWQGSQKSPYLEVDVFARDKKHAVKIANERRLHLIASNEWPSVIDGE